MAEDQAVGVAPVVAVVGPTAAGKSELALDLAERLGGEVVNTDAMQVYRGMDIGTAKLPVAERRGIPHHLVDVLEVTEPLSVAEFQRWARAEIVAIRERGRIPLLVGGSALYNRAIVDEFEFPGTDPLVRARLERELVEAGAPALHRRLAEVDPAAAEQILPSNARRVVRALEVIEIGGSAFSARLPEHRYHDRRTVQLGVAIDRATLDQRIEERVRRMWDAGLVEEVRSLAARGLGEGRTAARALGYQQVLAVLAGEITEEEARAQTVTGTRRFARRQQSWYRRDPRIHWLGYDDPARIEQAADLVRAAQSVP